MKRSLLIAAAIFLAFAFPAFAQNAALDADVAKDLPDLLASYKHLHENPELSTQEKETSAYIASALRQYGYEVTDHFGQYTDPAQQSYGIVAVLKNGPGPVVYVRTELDALPVVEKTGLPYASKVKVKRVNDEVGVMHACGHDLHMTVFLGTAKMLVGNKNQWSGTVVMIGQPAEEVVGGAAAMLRAGLFTKFPKPDYVIALHDNQLIPAGKVAWLDGPILAGADSVDITIRGYGGHGALPHTTKDPIVIASELVVFLQTIVSREEDPLDHTVITVGSFHAGSKHNIIPDEAKLQLTVRTMTPAQRDKTLAAITRATNGIAAAAGIPADRAPVIEISKDGVPATINDSAFTGRVRQSLIKELGAANVVQGQPFMASEDFSLFALDPAKPTTMMFWLGATDPSKLKDAEEKGTRVPSLHSSEFAPLPEPAISAGVRGMTTAVMDLLPKKQSAAGLY